MSGTLVERLREDAQLIESNGYDGYGGNPGDDRPALLREAADALEAMEKDLTETRNLIMIQQVDRVSFRNLRAEVLEVIKPFTQLSKAIEAEWLDVIVEGEQRATPVRFAVERLGDRVLSMHEERRALAALHARLSQAGVDDATRPSTADKEKPNERS